MKQNEDPLSFDSNPSLTSKILDILNSGAKGYAAGAGGRPIPEASFAGAFSGGYEAQKAEEDKNKVLKALDAYRSTPDYKGLSETEKVALRTDPASFLKARAEKPRTKIFLSSIYPGISPDVDREIELGETDLLKIQAALEKKNAARTAAEQRAADLKDRKEERGVDRELRKEMADERQQGMRDRNEDEQVRKFSTSLDKIGAPDAIAALVPLQDLIKKSGEVPGYGPMESLTPGVLEQFLNPKGQAARQLVQGLSNVKLKLQSGSAVTVPEFDRFAKAFGSGVFKTEAQLRNGLQQALNEYRKRLDNAMGGVRPEIRQKFFENNNLDDYAITLGGLDFGGVQGNATPAKKKDDFTDLQSQGLFK